MESSSDEESFSAHEWITPQSSIRATYQSHAEKGIRKICSELLDLKEAIENLGGNMQSKYLAFLRLSEEVIEAEQELIELKKHVSAQGMLVQDLMSSVSSQLDVWSKYNEDSPAAYNLHSDIDGSNCGDFQDPKVMFIDKFDILLAEHRIEEALLALDAEEKSLVGLMNGSGKEQNVQAVSFKNALVERKLILEDQLVCHAKQPSISASEQKKALSGLIKLGKSSLAHKLLLEGYSFRLRKNIGDFLPSSPIYPETFSATLCQLVFSAISTATKASVSMFGDMALNTNKIVQWAEYELETYVRHVRENSPSLESDSALRSACICMQASMNHCAAVESQGLKFSELLTVLLHPYVEEVIDVTFRRARRKIVDLAKNDEILVPSSQLESPYGASLPLNFMLTSSGKEFMGNINDILDQLSPMVILRFGGTVLNKILMLFDRYVESLMTVFPGHPEDDILVDAKELKAESDAQQLALIGTAYTLADELLPMSVSKIFAVQKEKKGTGEGLNSGSVFAVEFKDWRRHLQHSLDKLRDRFCMQYVVTFIYLEGKARFNAKQYADGKNNDLFWDSNPMPSLPFQALFGRLQQLASVARDVLHGKDKVQKILLSRLIETVVMWLSNEQEFWDVFDDDSVELQPSGLQQLLLDMHFLVEIAVRGRNSSRAVHQLVSGIIAKAIGVFSARGIDPQSALPEDEWFVDTAKSAISKLLLGTSGSESSEIDEPIELDDEISDSEISSSIVPSTVGSEESYASANNGDFES